MLRADGWIAYGGKASKGPADVIAIKAGERNRLIQVKSDAGNPFANFKPRERQALLDEAERGDADAELFWWPPNGKLRVILPDEWPKVRLASISANCGLDSTSVEAA